MIRECLFANNPQLVGDPVDTYSGAVVERQRDFRLAGPLPLEWFRVYNSQLCEKVFALGRGQSHEFASCLRFDIDGIRFEGPLGERVWFSPLIKDGQTASGNGKRLKRISERVYHLHEHAQPVREFVFSDLTQAGQLKRIFRGSHQILIDYDKQSQLSSIIDSLENEIIVEFNSRSLLAVAFIPKTRFRERRTLIRYDYDQRDNIEVASDIYGNSLRFAYDAANRLQSRTDRNGHTFIYAYDDRGRCIHTTGDDGILDNRLDYEVDRACTKVTQSNGAVRRYRYELGKLVAIEEPLGGTKKFIYDDKGQLNQELDCNGNATKCVYNEDGALIGKVDSLGNYRAYPVDPNQPEFASHRVAQNAAEFEYGYLVDTTPKVAANSVDKDGGNVLNQNSLNNNEDTNLTSGHNFGFVVGRDWWPQPSFGRRFDIAGNLFQQTNQKKGLRRWIYDANGNVKKHVDFDGGVWKYGYRSWNQLVEKVNPLGVAQRFEYDAQENLKLFVDGGETRTEFGYDINGNLIEVRRHGQVRESYQRDLSGNVIGKFAADGRKLVDLEYGLGNQLLKRTLASGECHTYQYDARGRYLRASTLNDTIEFKYDALGNRCEEKRNGIGVEHVYRGWGQFGVSVWLENFICRYRQDADQSLLVTDPTGGKHRLQVSKSGTVQRLLGHGTQEVIKYDELGRCESRHVTRAGRKDWLRTYQWSGEGDLRETSDSVNGNVAYSYDAAHRLKSRIDSRGVYSEYVLDDASNLTKLPNVGEIALQPGNRLLYADGESFEYNDRNHISVRKTSSNTIRYTYDSRDQLIAVDSKSLSWTAQYDALGRRVRKTVNGKTTEYLWNTDQLAAEVSSRGLRLYVYADCLSLTPIMFVDYASINADPTTGICYFIFCDQIGTPVCIENSNGKVVWQARIEPFGEAILSADNEVEFNLRFPGHYWDADTGLNYNRFRFYDARLGRYIQSDPIGLAGGANVYAYPANPLGFVDVRGLNCPHCGTAHPPTEACPEIEGPPPPEGAPARISPEMANKICVGEIRGNRIVGGHGISATTSSLNDAQIIQTYPNGVSTGYLVSTNADGTALTTVKGAGGTPHTFFPPSWSDDHIINTTEQVANSPRVATQNDGSTIHRQDVNGVTVEVVKRPDGEVVASYPVAPTT